MPDAVEITLSTGNKVSLNYQSHEVSVSIIYQLEREDTDVLKVVEEKAKEVAKAHAKAWRAVRDEKTGKEAERYGENGDKEPQRHSPAERIELTKNTKTTTSTDVGTDKEIAQAETLVEVSPERSRSDKNDGMRVVSLNGTVVAETATFQAQLNGSRKALSYDPNDPFAEDLTVTEVSENGERELQEQASHAQIRTLLALAGKPG